MTALNTAFLIKNAAALQWTAALCLLNLIIGTFFSNQGHWEFDSFHAGSTCNGISLFIYTMIALRLFKSRDNLNIQLLMLLLLLPKPDEVVTVIVQKTFVVLVVFTRWMSVKRASAILLIAGAIVAAPILMFCLNSISEFSTPKNGKFISSTDNLYNLYRYQNKWSRKSKYRLFREIRVCPGLRPVKEVNMITTAAPVQVTRSEAGKYIIETGQEITKNPKDTKTTGAAT